jgi:hypothetical protein
MYWKQFLSIYGTPEVFYIPFFLMAGVAISLELLQLLQVYQE